MVTFRFSRQLQYRNYMEAEKKTCVIKIIGLNSQKNGRNIIKVHQRKKPFQTGDKRKGLNTRRRLIYAQAKMSCILRFALCGMSYGHPSVCLPREACSFQPKYSCVLASFLYSETQKVCCKIRIYFILFLLTLLLLNTPVPEIFYFIVMS